MPKKNTLATLGDTPTADGEFAYEPLQGFASPTRPELSLDLQSPDYGAIPRVSGGVTLPFLGNQLSVTGEYQHDPSLADWRVLLGFKRPF